MLLWATFDQNSNITRLKLLDSTVATGAGKTGLSSASSGLIISTIADSEATPTVYTQAGSTIETITTLATYAAPTATKCRFKEVDATNHKGIYELQFADARFSIAAAKSLLISISGVTGVAECDAVIPLPVIDLFAATVPATVAGNVGGNVVGSVGSIATGGIAAASFATGAIDAAAIAADAIGASELATGAVNEIRDAILSDSTPFAGADVATIKGRLPTTLVGGRIDASVGAMAADVVTAAAIAADAIGSSELATTAVNEIRDAILSDSTPFAGASVAAIKAKTDNLPTDPADASDIAGSFSTVNATLATIAGYVDTEVAAIKAKTDNLPADPADASDIAAAFGTVNSTLGTIAGYVDTEVAAIKAKTDQLTFTVANQVDANALSGGGAGLTAQQTRDAMKLAPTAGSPAVDSIDEELDGIKAKTDNLPASPANETTVAAVKAKTDSLPTDPADASDIAASFSTVNTTLGTIAGYIDTEVAAIKAKTDNLPSDPADQSLVIAATDAIMGRIGVPAGASIAADIAEIEGETDDIAAVKAKTDQFAFTVANQVDANALTGGGTGLTAQQTRDAMKLAPTAGAPDAGSVDEELDILDAKLGPITGSGDNSVLGLFRAVMRNDFFPVPTDVGGTYAISDSLQEISATVAAIPTPDPPLTAQQTRDAMELASTAAADGIDSQLLLIGENIDALKVREVPMSRGLPFNAFEFVMYDATDHTTPMTGLTVTAERSLDGAAFEPCDNAPAEVSNGVYEIDLTADDNNAKVFTLRFTAPGADDTLVTILTTPVLI